MQKPRPVPFTPYFLPLENAEAIVNGSSRRFSARGMTLRSTPGLCRTVRDQYATDWQEPWLSFKDRVDYCDCGFEGTLVTARPAEKKTPAGYAVAPPDGGGHLGTPAARMVLRSHRKQAV